MAEKVLWGEMTRLELEKISGQVDTILLPVGSLEQHGPHLPLDTDSFDAMYILLEAVEKLDPPRPPILPTISYGLSEHHMAFSGTVTLRPETLFSLIFDIGRSAKQHGFEKIFIYNAHGGNTNVLKEAALQLKYELDLTVFIDSGESMEPGKRELVNSKNDVHAGEYETSTSLANRIDLVDQDKIKKPTLTFPDESFEFDHKPAFFYTWSTDELTDTGVIGDPTKATVDKGEQLWDGGIKLLAERIKTVMEL